jgi:hypothetical protein
MGLNLIRYRVAIDRSRQRALHELQRLPPDRAAEDRPAHRTRSTDLEHERATARPHRAARAVFDETEEDFRRFHPELMRVLLQPKGGMEGQLSERAVICAWRLRRVYRIETGMLSKVRKSWAPAPHDQRTARNAVSRAAVGRIIPSDDD